MFYDSFPSVPTQTKLHDAIAMLQLCNEFADASEQEYVADFDADFDLDLILETGAIARTSIRLLQELAGESKQASHAVLVDAIRNHKATRNFFPHVEQITLALGVAAKALQEAVDEDANRNGNEADRASDTMAAVHRCVESQALLFESSTLQFGQEELLSNFQSGKKLVTA